MPRFTAKIATSLVIALAAAGTARSGDLRQDQARREYESLKRDRTRLLEELQASWRELDEGPPPGPDAPSRLAQTATREQRAREREAVLVSVLARGRELRQELALAALAPAKDAVGEKAGPMEGSWRLTFEGQDGRLSLVQVGALVTGTWSISGRGRGTVLGHAGAAKIALGLIDDKGDMFAMLQGSIAGPTSVDGTYLRRELAAGEPAQGVWSARRAP